MRGNTLNAMIQMLRRELKLAESPALGKNVRASHAHALRSAQERLFDSHDWSFKKIYRDIPGAAGQRYYAPPADLPLENIRKVQVLVGTLWRTLDRGVGIHEYNQVNSDAGIRQDYIRRWEVYNDPTTDGDMIEAWPIPASDNLSTMRFHGVRKLPQLIADNDKAYLDDLAIVLTAAADLVPVKDAARAQAKADKHVFSLVRNLSDGRTFVSGGGSDPGGEKYRPPQIVIAQ